MATAGVLHRIGAVITFGYFAFHIFNLARKKRRKRLSLTKFIFTGHIPLEHFKHERPREYQEIKEAGELDKRVLRKSSPKRKRTQRLQVNKTATRITWPLLPLQ